MKVLNLDWSIWFYGMWVAIATGSSSSVISGLTLKLMDDTVFNRNVWTFAQYIGVLLVVGAVKDFFLYINKHPAPEIISQDKHMDVKSTTLPQKGTGDGTQGNLPERIKTVKTTTEEEVKVAPKPEDK